MNHAASKDLNRYHDKLRPTCEIKRGLFVPEFSPILGDGDPNRREATANPVPGWFGAWSGGWVDAPTEVSATSATGGPGHRFSAGGTKSSSVVNGDGFWQTHRLQNAAPWVYRP